MPLAGLALMTVKQNLTYVKRRFTYGTVEGERGVMIQSFRSKALGTFFQTGNPKGVPANLAKRAVIRLDALDNATSLEELKYWRCHPLNTNPVRYALDVNGPWRLTFEWRNGDACLVDLEQYH